MYCVCLTRPVTGRESRNKRKGHIPTGKPVSFFAKHFMVQIEQSEIYNILWKICHEDGSRLCPVELPTGSGKSTAMNQVIIDCVTSAENGADRKRKFFIITNRLNNLKQSDDQLRKALPGENQVLFLRSIEDTLKSFFANDAAVPQTIRQLEEYQKLQQMVKGQSSSDEIRKANSSLRYQLYGILNDEIKSTGKKNTDKEFNEMLSEYIHKSAQWQFLYRLYPAMLIPYADVILLSVDKLYRPLKTITQSVSHFYDAPFLRQSEKYEPVIFFDESDADSTRLRDLILDSVSSSYINLIDVLREFGTSAVTPSALAKKTGLRQNEIEKRQKEIRGSYKQYHGYNFMSDRKIRDEAANQFLFKSGSTVASSRGNALYIHADDENEVNQIYSAGSLKSPNDIKKQDPDDKSLKDVMSSISDLIEHRAISYLYYLATGYWKKLAHDNAISYPEAFQTMMHVIGLSEPTQKYIMDNIFLYGKKHDREADIGSFDSSFYARGFSLSTLKDDRCHNEDTFLELRRCFTTPEKIVAHLADNAKVFLVSATAKTKSVICNYNFQWLRQRLGDIYRPLTKEETAALSKWYDAQNDYSDVHVQLERLQNMPESTKSTAMLFTSEGENPKCIDPEDCGIIIYEKLQTVLPNVSSDPGNRSFFWNRYLKIFQAYQTFIVKNIESMLVIGNQYWGQAVSFNEDALQSGFDLINEYYGIPENSVIYIQLKNNDSEDEIDHAFEEGKRCFVYSVYQAIGVGRNLQHAYNKTKKPPMIRVNNREDNGKKDYDALCLLAPTYVIPNINENAGNSDRMKALYITEALHDRFSEELRDNEERNIITELVSSKWKYSGYYSKAVRKTTSYKMAQASQIIQAIGRLGRTCWRTKKEYILIDENAVDSIARLDKEPDHIYTPEMQTVIKCCKDYCENYKNEQNKEKDKDDPLTRIEEILRTSSNDAEYYIYRLLKRDENGAFIHMREWKALREAVLTPVTSQEDYLRLPPIGRLAAYCELPEQIAKELSEQIVDHYIDHYTYNAADSFDEEQGRRRYRVTDVSLHDGKKLQHTVSAEAVRLNDILLIPGMRQFFENHHYRTDLRMKGYMMPPVIVNNILKGVLGEVAVAFICRSQLKIPLEEISDPAQFEFFDFHVPGTRIYIDCKNLSENAYVVDDTVLNEGVRKAKECNASTIIYVQATAHEKYPFTPIKARDGIRIIELPGLYKIANGKAVRNDNFCNILKEACRGEAGTDKSSAYSD